MGVFRGWQGWGWVGLTIAAIIFVITPPSWAQTPLPPPSTAAEVYFFHSETCPHCREQMPLMQDIAAYNPTVKVHIIEVHQEAAIWQQFLQSQGIQSGAVPRTVVGDRQFIGYDPADGPLEYTPQYKAYIGYRNQIIAAITTAAGQELQLTPLAPPAARIPSGWVWLLPGIYLASGALLRDRLTTAQRQRYWIGGLLAILLLTTFLFLSLIPATTIRTFAQELPFPLFVSTIALADGFNPCAFTVLVILLSLLTYTKRRQDMAWIGGTFIVTSAVMYFLFIMLMVGLGAVLLEQYGTLVLAILGTGITIAGMINIKDFFWFKEGVTLSLSENQQRTISQKAGKIVRQLRAASAPKAPLWQFWTALGGTVLLAVFVNIVELGCTAILPVVYMTSLVSYCDASGVAALGCYSGWTAFYAALYIAPLLLILAGFIYSFESARVTESQGRWLKLGAGIFMLFFGLVMLFKPQFLTFGT